MSTKEERLDLLRFAIEQCGDFRMYLEAQNNEILNMATTNDRVTLHEVGFCKAPWATW
jgi:hypothetical protein